MRHRRTDGARCHCDQSVMNVIVSCTTCTVATRTDVPLMHQQCARVTQYGVLHQRRPSAPQLAVKAERWLQREQPAVIYPIDTLFYCRHHVVSPAFVVHACVCDSVRRASSAPRSLDCRRQNRLTDTLVRHAALRPLRRGSAPATPARCRVAARLQFDARGKGRMLHTFL